MSVGGRRLLAIMIVAAMLAMLSILAIRYVNERSDRYVRDSLRNEQDIKPARQ